MSRSRRSRIRKRRESENIPMMIASTSVIVVILLLVCIGFMLLHRQQVLHAARASEKMVPCLIKGEGRKSNKYERTDKLMYTDRIRYTRDDLSHLDEYGLKLTRNEIYARHGRMFNDQELQSYFDSQPWYMAEYSPGDFDEDCLNSVERANIRLIANCELERGYD